MRLIDMSSNNVVMKMIQLKLPRRAGCGTSNLVRQIMNDCLKRRVLSLSVSHINDIKEQWSDQLSVSDLIAVYRWAADSRRDC